MWSNLLCWPGLLFKTSHFNTMSPTWNSRARALLSKLLLIYIYWYSIVFMAFFLVSSNSISWAHLTKIGSPSSNKTSCIARSSAGNYVSMDNLASFPYTSLYGEFLITYFGVILSTHKAAFNFECQSLWFSCKLHLMILIRFLFEDSANPLPYG